MRGNRRSKRIACCSGERPQLDAPVKAQSELVSGSLWLPSIEAMMKKMISKSTSTPQTNRVRPSVVRACCLFSLERISFEVSGFAQRVDLIWNEPVRTGSAGALARYEREARNGCPVNFFENKPGCARGCGRGRPRSQYELARPRIIFWARPRGAIETLHLKASG